MLEVGDEAKCLDHSVASTPQSPVYKRLVDSSSATTPGDFSPGGDVLYQKLVQAKTPTGNKKYY